MEEAHEGRLLAKVVDPVIRRVVRRLRHFEHHGFEVRVWDFETKIVEGPASVEDPGHDHMYVEAQRSLPAALLCEVIVEGRR